MALGELPELAALLALGFVIGSIPTSIIVGRLYGGIDIRQHGSGNAGTTNVIRQLGWGPGLLVFAVDVAKGHLAVTLASLLGLDPFGWGAESARAIAGASAVAGHIWTLFARFRGGKGVATALGALLALHPVAAGICMLLFVVVVSLTRLVSLGSMAAGAAVAPLLLLLSWAGGRPLHLALLLFAIAVALLILFAHRSNIARLVRSAEPRFRPPAKRR
jgi:glycerol-3-phosphate acyltransferase PlsY